MKILKKSSENRSERMNITAVVILVVLSLYVISLFVPLVWAFITSFKKQTDFRVNIIGLPEEWVWNYSYIFKMFYVRVQSPTGLTKISMGEMYINSFLYAGGCAFFHTLVPCITAYACARFPFQFSKVIYTIVVVTMVMPIVGSLPSEIAMAQTFGLYDSIVGMWLMKCNFLGMYFLVFYNAFKTMPMGYSEAASIDGAGNLRILLQIILPLVKNLFFTVLLINFISYWNDYQVPLVYMPTHPTIAYGMYIMGTTTENSLSTVPMRMTSAIMMLVPILMLFLAFHKRLLGNLTMGGLKG